LVNDTRQGNELIIWNFVWNLFFFCNFKIRHKKYKPWIKQRRKYGYFIKIFRFLDSNIKIIILGKIIFTTVRLVWNFQQENVGIEITINKEFER
jgi:hypothetical protein